VFGILALVSFLLFAASFGFYLRSLWVDDVWAQFTSEMNVVASVQSNRGSLNIFYADGRYLVDRGATDVRLRHYSGPARAVTGAPYGLTPRMGFAYRPLPPNGALMMFPHWAIVFGSAVIPAWWVIAWSRRRLWRRRNPTACGNCGYDLRASEGVCPECGKLVSDR